LNKASPYVAITMQRIPVEVAERIIANLSDEDLFIGSSVCRV